MSMQTWKYCIHSGGSQSNVAARICSLSEVAYNLFVSSIDNDLNPTNAANRTRNFALVSRSLHHKPSNELTSPGKAYNCPSKHVKIKASKKDSILHNLWHKLFSSHAWNSSRRKAQHDPISSRNYSEMRNESSVFSISKVQRDYTMFRHVGSKLARLVFVTGI